MSLLDLPVEIFEAIIHAYLDHHGGWAAAVQARYVCKTFALAIHNDMFGRYSPRHYRCFNTDWKERLLGPNMHTVLFRIGPTRCSSTYILHHMEATIDFLMEFSYYQTQPQRERYRLALCNAMSAALTVNDILAYLCEGPFDDSIKVRRNMGRADTIGMLAAAAAVNSGPALRFLVGKVRDVGQRSELYGTPLTAAAVNGHLYSATFIYEHMEGGVPVWNQLYEAIDTCMYKQRATILPILMGWYLKHCDSAKLLKESKHIWTDWAISRGELDVLHLCYDPSHATMCKRQLKATPFYLACQHGHANIIQYFLQIDPALRGAIRACRKGSTMAHELLEGLAVAVEHGWLVATRLLIQSGVQINQTAQNGTSFTPALWYAVKGGHVDMVLLLLAYGAVVPKRNCIENDGIWALAANQGWRMARLIKEAWNAQVKPKPSVDVGSAS